MAATRPSLRRAKASARVLRSLAASWRIGRGRKVDRQALIDGGVTDKFIDRVTEIAESVNGDAARLLAALESGQAKGFRKATGEKLKLHLEETGHLDERERLPKDQLRMHALAAAAADIKAGLLAAADVEQILARSLPNNHPDLPLLKD